MTLSRRAFVKHSALGAGGMAAALVSLTESGMAAPADEFLQPSRLHIDAAGFRLKQVVANGIVLNYAVAGSGPAILLIHGWPFTWETWHKVIPELAKSFTVIAPDMRGMGGSSKPDVGYDVKTLADDMAALLASESVENAVVVGHDLGVGVAFQLAASRPHLVRKLVLTESIVLGAPKAEIFMSEPPWWVAFHSVPDLPEALTSGREAAYLDWFFTNLTHGGSGIGRSAREQHIAAYSQIGAMRGGFNHYRAFPKTTLQGRNASQKPLKMPVLALGGDLVGDILFQQMAAIGGDVRGGRIEGTGHVIQDENPNEFLRRLRDFM